MEARRLATYDDLLQVPDHLVAEIVYGALHTSPRPAPPHAVASSGLGSDLHQLWQRGRGGPGGWWILFEPEVHGHGHVLVPDIAGWRKSTLPLPPRDRAWFETRPDWVCEVLSPSTARLDRGDKQRAYGELGVPWLWLVDPLARFVEVLQRQDDGRYLRTAFATDETDAALPPFEATPLDIAGLWLPDAP